jgi:hypothetical protein
MIAITDDARIYCESNERAGAFALHGWGQRWIGNVELNNKHTTAFTIAVRSAQIVPPVTCYNTHRHSKYIGLSDPEEDNIP